MSIKAVWWMLLAAMALAAILLFNYWASYQLLSTLVYTGIVLALFGLANMAVPFRFLGIRKRVIGALLMGSGVILALAALSWPAPTVRIAQHKTVLDDVMPEYQFYERHSARIHARSEQVMQAVRQSTFGDMKSLATLLKIRGAALRIHDTGDFLQNKRVLDSFSASGFLTGGSEHEIVMCGGANVRAQRPLGCVLCRSSQIIGSRARSKWLMTSTWKMRATDGPESAPKRVSWRLTIPPAAAWAVTGD